MRIHVKWNADTPLELPLAYHRILQGVVYQSMRNAYDHSEFVHSEGYFYGRRNYRMFCFSHIFGKARVENQKIIFSGPLFFEISSPDTYLMQIIAQSIEENGLCFGKQKYDRVAVILSDTEIEAEAIKVRATSPIVVYSTDEVSKKTKYFTPWDSEFQPAVNQNFKRKYKAFYGVEPESGVRITPLLVKPQDKCVTKYKDIYITGYSGIYLLEGTRKYLNFLYQTGVGAKNSQGFGMIETVK